MKAYMLIKIMPGQDLEELKHALQDPSIENIDLIMGNYDVIATVQADDLSALGKLATLVRNCPGIQDSVTCPVIS